MRTNLTAKPHAHGWRRARRVALIAAGAAALSLSSLNAAAADPAATPVRPSVPAANPTAAADLQAVAADLAVIGTKPTISPSASDDDTAAPMSAIKTWSWGAGSDGQLGNGTNNSRSTPGAVATPPALAGQTIVKVSSGYSHACGITDAGNGFCWGNNGFGALGTPGPNSNVPVAVNTTGALAGKKLLNITAGRGTTCAVADDNRAYCWGWGAFGQLGNGTTGIATTPVPVNTAGVLADKAVTSVTLGDFHACAVAADGSASCWGRNVNGELGTGTPGNSSSVPVAVLMTGQLSGARFSQIDAGGYHNCARTSGGLVFCWGSNDSGQLGDGTTASSASPVRIALPQSLQFELAGMVAAGDAHSCMTTTFNLPICWGKNSAGQLGVGSAGPASSVPARVAQGGLPNTEPSRAITAGGDSTCTIANTGVVACWGENSSGQLGLGNTTNRNAPTLTSVGSDPTRPAADVSLGTDSATAATSPLGQPFTPLTTPMRVFDSRTSTGPGSAAKPLVIDATGAGKVAYPPGTTAIAYNLTVTGQSASGFATITPGDVMATPNSSTINWQRPQQTVANGFVVGLPLDRRIKAFIGGTGTAEVIVDVVGYYAPNPTGGKFVPIDPVRAYSSGASVISGGQQRTVDLAATTSRDLPPGTTAIAYNLTLTGTTGSGYLAVAPGGTATAPTVSTANWTGPNQTLANATVVGLQDRRIEVFAAGGSTQFIVDIVGYFIPAAELPPGVVGSDFYPVDPVRAYDSRNSGGPLAGNPATGGVGAPRNTVMSAGGVVPLSARAVAYNLTVTGTGGSGFLSVTPGGSANPTTSSINWTAPGTTLANGSAVGIDRALQVRSWVGGRSDTQYLLDVAGYYQ